MRDPTATMVGRHITAILTYVLLVVAVLAVRSPADATECGDLDNNGSISAADALLVLRKAVGAAVPPLQCPSVCVTTTSTTTTTAIVDECFNDSDCQGRPGGPYCCGNVCAECTLDEHCPAGFGCDGTCACVPRP